MNDRIRQEIENHMLRANVLENEGQKESAGQQWFIADCLRSLLEIFESGNCNECGNVGCPFLPKVGALVRFNCPHYIKKEQDAKIVERGKCAICGNPLSQGLFLCSECKAKEEEKK